MISKVRIFLLTIAIGFCVFPAAGFREPEHEGLPNLDVREGRAAARGMAPGREGNAARIKEQLPSVQVEFDPLAGGAKMVRSLDGFLTGPAGEGRALSRGTLEELRDDPHRITKSFLHEHRELFGHGPELLNDARIHREFSGRHNGLKTVVWQQELDGIPVFEALLISHTTRAGELVSIGSQFVPDLIQAAERGTTNRNALLADPLIRAEDAVLLASENIGEKDAAKSLKRGAVKRGPEQRQEFHAVPLNGVTHAQLVWFPASNDELRLCWQVLLTSKTRGEMFKVLVDAQNGEVLLRHCLTEYISDATYHVYTSDSPSPFSPGHFTPQTNQPPQVPRSFLTLSAWSTNASPAGWIDDGDNETIGNNVAAHLDRNADDVPDPGSRPQGSPFRVFDFPLDLAQEPTNFAASSVVQLFYWNNWMHDQLYELGFTEEAGNFQTTNFNRGGWGEDAVLADAQDGSGFNNANMTTPPDGYPARMQMYRFNGPTPDRDGSLDAEVVLHEYTHGLSNRRVGGGGGLSALQARGLGEGWSDFFSLALLAESSDDPGGNYPTGGYLTLLLGTGFYENYYFGIRRYPYSTNLAKNPLTFRDIDPGKASAHLGIPRNPHIPNTADAVHNIGEVWCSMLWEARANLIARYGFAQGNRMILQLVTDGMNLSPPNPNFVQARDAILLADLVNHGGDHQRELWLAFAKRGLGASAVCPASAGTFGVQESFALPDPFTIRSSTFLLALGPVGGPFNPASQTCLLTNNGPGTLPWKAGKSVAWLDLSQMDGTLSPSDSATVGVALNPQVNSLPIGKHSGSVWFTNLNTSVVRFFQVQVHVGQNAFHTEAFSGDHDLDFQTLTFTPQGSTNYTVCRSPAFQYPTEPIGGTNLPLNNFSYLQVTLGQGTNIAVYGRRTNVFYINSNGSISLVTGDASSSNTLTTHFNRPRVSGFLGLLRPASHGRVHLRALDDRVAVTFIDVVEGNTAVFNDFQMELFFDGRIRITHLNMASTTGVVGLSAGTGTPSGFVESDFSLFGDCLPVLSLVPATLESTEGSGTLQATLQLSEAPATDLQVRLSSSDPDQVTVPETLLIPAGSTFAPPVTVTVVDDAMLDGTQTAIISAFAEGFRPALASVKVHDNETSTLQVLLPATVTEGTAVAGEVTLLTAPARDFTVSLVSSQPSRLSVPAEVIVPAGFTNKSFTATAVNNTKIEGPVEVTVTASVMHWVPAQRPVTILDNDPAQLMLSLPATIMEGTPKTGSVQLSGTLTTNLSVTLMTSDSDLQVPASVTVTAGSQSANFSITPVDDDIYKPLRNISISAAAPAFGGTNRTIELTDNDLPAAPILPTPANLATNVIASADLAWLSGEASPKPNLYHVYLGTVPTPGAGQYLGSTTNTAWSLPLLAPDTTYYWKIIAERSNVQTSSAVWRFTTRGLHRFEWDPIAPVQHVNQPFLVTLRAVDEFGQLVSSHSAPVQLGAHLGPEHQPVVRILSFTNYTDNSREYPNTVEAIQRHFEHFTIANTGNTNAAVLQSLLADKHVLLIPEQEGLVFSPVLWTNLPLAWKSTLTNFAHKGGMVVVCSYQLFEHNFLNDTGLMTISRVDSTASASLNPSVTPHPLTEGLPSVFNGSFVGRYNSSGANVAVYSAPFSYHTVIERKFGAGHAVMIGTDYNTNNTPMDRVIANAIKLAQNNIRLNVPHSPTVSGAFSNGVWTGWMTIHAINTNIYLSASNAAGLTAASVPFDVISNDDLSLVMNSWPAVAGPGAPVTYELQVINHSTNLVSGVRLTNTLPAQAAFLSGTTTHGTFSHAGGVVVAELGNIAARSNAIVRLQVSGAVPGLYTNRAFVSRTLAEAFLENNFAENITTIVTPVVSIRDISMTEGSSTALATFQLTLAPVAGYPVTVQFNTANGSALAGSDYLATNGTITLLPGETNAFISVPILGDWLNEGDETFSVQLHGVTNAVLERVSALATLLDDDAFPVLQLADATLLQEFCLPTNGVVGQGETVTFAISLTNPTALPADAVMATLLPTNGVVPLNAVVDFGDIPAHGSATRLVSFTANAPCGTSLALLLRLQSGPTDLGSVTHFIPLCAENNAVNQDFDAAATFPAGWSTAVIGAAANWTLTTATNHTPPRSIFVPNLAQPGTNRLISPPMRVSSFNAQVSFRHFYNTELYFDGCVLELSVDDAPFTNIVSLGGTFLEGGYNGFNQTWTGNSEGFTNSVARLPASTFGKMVRFGWALRADISRAGHGWYVDSIVTTESWDCVADRAPQLHVSAGSDRLLLHWFAPPGYLLESSATLSPPTWTVVPHPFAITNGWIMVEEPPVPGGKFYRLRK